MMSCCDKNDKKSPWRIVFWAVVVVGFLAVLIVLDARGQEQSATAPTEQRGDLALAPTEQLAIDSRHEHSNSDYALDHTPSSNLSVAFATGGDVHDHSSHQHQETTGFAGRLLNWLGKFHPAATDFPIAMLMGAAAAELMLVLTGRVMFESSARFMVWLACLSAVPAVVLGWFYAGFRWADSNWVMTLHRWLGTGIGLWVLLLVLLCQASSREGARGDRVRPWYRAALFLSVVGVAANGFFGGALVYGIDHYAW